MNKLVKVEVSARHIHLSENDFKILFGNDTELTFLKELSQIDQFAASEKVDLISEYGKINGVRILGPLRSETQVELSQTDSRILKINPPLRLSGDISGSIGIKIVGPVGEVIISEGVIVAKRHFHCTPETAKELNLNDDSKISVKVGDVRQVIFNEVEVRISDKFTDAIHVDTDEGNAFSMGGICTMGEIVK